MKTLSKYVTEKLIIFPSQVNEKLIVNKNYNNNIDVDEFTRTNNIFEIFIRYNKDNSSMKDKEYMFIDCVVGKVTGSGNNFIINGREILYGAEYDKFDVKATKDAVALYYHMDISTSEHMYIFLNPELYDNVISFVDKIQNQGKATIKDILSNIGIDSDDLCDIMSQKMLDETYEIACVHPDKIIDALVG